MKVSITSSKIIRDFPKRTFTHDKRVNTDEHAPGLEQDNRGKQVFSTKAMLLPNFAELEPRLKALVEKLMKLIIDNPSMICVKSEPKKTPHAGV